MTKTMFFCEISKVYSKIENIRKMMNTDEYHLLSNYVEMGKKSEILDNVREGLAYEITNKLLWDNHKCERLYDTIRYNIKVLLSKSYCDWMTINETVKLLEELGVEFREG